MPIDERTVRHLEQLAALRLDDEERRLLAGRLARIVTYVERLRELDTLPRPAAGAEAPAPAFPRAPLRDDTPQPSLPAAEALALSPAGRPDFFAVPPVLELAPDAGAGAGGPAGEEERGG